MKKLALVVLVLSIVGCAALPATTILGAKVLKDGMVKAEKDFDKFSSAITNYLEKQTEENKEALIKIQDKFLGIFKALKLAVDKQCDAIIVTEED